MFFWLRHRRACSAVDAELLERGRQRVHLSGSVSSLRIRFLVDHFPIDPRFSGEPGVSCLVSADDHTLLFDLGYNRRGERPSPLHRNLDAAGALPSRLDGIFISHNHLDHVGGAKCQRRRSPDLRQLPPSMGTGVLWAPVPLKPALLPCRCLDAATEIFPGVASSGALPAHLYYLGLLREQALLIDVRGRGLVLISGCGHPGILQMVRHASAITDRPVTGVVGGLHLIVSHGRTATQKYLGASRPPWAALRARDVRHLGEALRREGVQRLAPSAHDSCDVALDALRDVFGEGYLQVRAGGEISWGPQES
jgi:7,8-dihydropterin-6-yl-methyl-4-(beta-D-ribofuranosyl)aminobenzene 5'-phosphate synthase